VQRPFKYTHLIKRTHAHTHSHTHYVSMYKTFSIKLGVGLPNILTLNLIFNMSYTVKTLT